MPAGMVLGPTGMPLSSTSPMEALRTLEVGVFSIRRFNCSILKPRKKRNTPTAAPTRDQATMRPWSREETAAIQSAIEATIQTIVARARQHSWGLTYFRRTARQPAAWRKLPVCNRLIRRSWPSWRPGCAGCWRAILRPAPWFSRCARSPKDLPAWSCRPKCRLCARVPAAGAA